MCQIAVQAVETAPCADAAYVLRTCRLVGTSLLDADPVFQIDTLVHRCPSIIFEVLGAFSPGTMHLVQSEFVMDGAREACELGAPGPAAVYLRALTVMGNGDSDTVATLQKLTTHHPVDIVARTTCVSSWDCDVAVMVPEATSALRFYMDAVFTYSIRGRTRPLADIFALYDRVNTGWWKTMRKYWPSYIFYDLTDDYDIEKAMVILQGLSIGLQASFINVTYPSASEFSIVWRAFCEQFIRKCIAEIGHCPPPGLAEIVQALRVAQRQEFPSGLFAGDIAQHPEYHVILKHFGTPVPSVVPGLVYDARESTAFAINQRRGTCYIASALNVFLCVPQLRWYLIGQLNAEIAKRPALRDELDDDFRIEPLRKAMLRVVHKQLCGKAVTLTAPVTHIFEVIIRSDLQSFDDEKNPEKQGFGGSPLVTFIIMLFAMGLGRRSDVYFTPKHADDVPVAMLLTVCVHAVAAIRLHDGRVEVHDSNRGTYDLRHAEDNLAYLQDLCTNRGQLNHIYLSESFCKRYRAPGLVRPTCYLGAETPPALAPTEHIAYSTAMAAVKYTYVKPPATVLQIPKGFKIFVTLVTAVVDTAILDAAPKTVPKNQTWSCDSAGLCHFLPERLYKTPRKRKPRLHLDQQGL